MEIKDLPDFVRRVAYDLKEKWPNIYCLKINNDYYIIRTLTRGEFLLFVDLQQYMLGLEEDFVIYRCVLYPDISKVDLDSYKAGEICGIFDSIMNLSGFSSPELMESLIKSSREIMDLADSQIIATLCRAFPGITIEEINKFDSQKLSYYLALAEQILGVTLEFQKENKKQSPIIDFMAENNKMGRHGFNLKNGTPQKPIKP